MFILARQQRIYFFVLISLIIVFSLAASPQIIGYSENKSEAGYIGKGLEVLSEGRIFEVLEKNWNLGPAFRSVIMSGKMNADPNIKVNIQRTKTGYQADMKSMGSDKTFTIEWGIEDMLTQQVAEKFRNIEKEVPRLDFTGHAYWFRFTLTNPDDKPLDLLLELDKHMFSWFDLFYPKNGVYAMYRGAFEQPMSRRTIKESRTVFPIHLLPGVHTFFIRMDSRFIDTVPIRLWTKDEFYRHTTKNKFIHGCVTGATMLLLIYALFLAFSMKEIGYLYLSLLIFTGFMLHLSMSGLGFTFLWPEQPIMGIFFLCLMYPLTVIVNLLFCRHFLETKKYAPVIEIMFIGMLSVAGLLAVVQLFVPILSRMLFFGLSLGLDYLSVIPLLYAAIAAVKRGKKQGIYIIVAVGFQIFSYLEYWLSTVNIIPMEGIDFLHIRSIGFVLVMLLGVRSKIRYMEQALFNLRMELKEIINTRAAANKEKVVTDKTQIKVEAVKELIQSHYQEPLYRDDLAASVEMSSDHLGRMFKRLTGEKISGYINRLLNEIEEKKGMKY